MVAPRLVAILMCLAALAGCGGPAEPVWAPDSEVRKFAYDYRGPTELTLYTVVGLRNGSGVHSGLLIASPGERILFDPAGSFKLPFAPERNDVVYGMTDRALAVYIDYHARETHKVIEQKLPVTADEARLIAALAKGYGAVPKAQCALSISRILNEVKGFGSVRVGYYPKSLMQSFGALPGATTREITDDDADKNHNVLLVAGFGFN
ncbi:hypothetical protein EF888_20390 [Silicimonas algicola]|uniref:Lipoprotein n=1 Tax=Silicimonas algicola TaxID=1826607 RepID=A0A316G5X5_9RHOB|nr:hypothetical protein [Silicimonas algicola]AZQ69290.1 hypothetical protein EF888_20390 [Silicimonas algicola]PWK56349.1 hypothetical protein C8D95_10420 [Silicimonas algicola]